VCLGSANLVRNLETAMQQEAEACVASGPIANNVLELFFEQNPQEEQALNEISTVYDEAAPEPMGKRSGQQAEMCILTLPQAPAAQRFNELAQKALPQVDFEVATGGDDILVYREITNINLTDLEQMGPLAYDAYRQINAVNRFMPHARTDISFVVR